MEIKFPFKYYHVTDTIKETLYTVSKLDNGKVRIEWTEENGSDFDDNGYTVNDAERFVNDGTWVIVEEKPKYIHDAIIRAWLDGEQIQFKDYNSEWLDLKTTLNASFVPPFDCAVQYRIKPKIEQVSFILSDLANDNALREKVLDADIVFTANIEDGKVISISVQ